MRAPQVATEMHWLYPCVVKINIYWTYYKCVALSPFTVLFKGSFTWGALLQVHVFPTRGWTDAVCTPAPVSHSIPSGHAAWTQPLRSNTTCGLVPEWVPELTPHLMCSGTRNRTHPHAIPGHSGCAHATACPNRNEWDAGTGIQAAPVHPHSGKTWNCTGPAVYAAL